MEKEALQNFLLVKEQNGKWNNIFIYFSSLKYFFLLSLKNYAKSHCVNLFVHNLSLSCQKYILLFFHPTSSTLTSDDMKHYDSRGEKLNEIRANFHSTQSHSVANKSMC